MPDNVLGFEGAKINVFIYGLVGRQIRYKNKCEPHYSADPEQKHVRFVGTQKKVWSFSLGR